MRTNRINVIWGLLAVLACQFGFVSGCSSFVGCRDDPEFTPDGNGLVFLHSEEHHLGLFGMGWFLGAATGSAELRWVSVPDGDEIASVIIAGGTVTSLTPRPPEHVRHRSPGMVISPDSQHLAYVREEGDVLIVGRDGAHRILKDAARVGGVSGIAWVSPTDIAYAEKWPVAGDSDPEEITIWLQAISGDAERRLVYRHTTDSWHHTYWSPGGRHVLIQQAYRLELLDVTSGEIIPLALSQEPSLRGVAWSPDGKKLFLLVWDGTYGTHEGPYRLLFVLVEPEGGRIIAKWDQVHQRFPSLAATGLPSDWTAESRYVVLRSSEDHWVLFDPASREIHDLDERLSDHFPERGIDELYGVGALPVAGWLWVCAAPRSRQDPTRVFAMDYEGRHFVEIARGSYWAVSPDGRYVADTDAERQLQIREIHLPSLPARGSGTASLSAGKTCKTWGR